MEFFSPSFLSFSLLVGYSQTCLSILMNNIVMILQTYAYNEIVFDPVPWGSWHELEELLLHIYIGNDYCSIMDHNLLLKQLLQLLVTQIFQSLQRGTLP